MGEGSLGIWLAFDWPGETESVWDIVGDALGEEALGSENYNYAITKAVLVEGRQVTPDTLRMEIHCELNSQTSWQNISVALRKIVFRLAEAGVERVDTSLQDSYSSPTPQLRASWT